MFLGSDPVSPSAAEHAPLRALWRADGERGHDAADGRGPPLGGKPGGAPSLHLLRPRESIPQVGLHPSYPASALALGEPDAGSL